MQYGMTSYQMGHDDELVDDELVDDNDLVQPTVTAPITKANAVKAKAELNRMRSSLTQWLKYRAINDEVAAGRGDSVPAPFLKKPGAKPMPPQAMAMRLRVQRLSDEGTLAKQLHALLSEVFDPGTLPDPNIDKNPNAAVELAKIAIAGKIPSDKGPQAQGFIWLWPIAIVVGGIALVIMFAIRSSADVAKERERLECIKAGKCTDTGFWLKVAAVGVVGWLVWDKAGLGSRITGAFKKGGR